MPPKVSIIVPCYNEQSTIRLLLEALCAQSYPRSDMEVVIADGMSQDGTRDAIAAFQKEFPELEVRVVENTRRNIPSGLNRAIEAALGEYIVRFDGHSKPYPDYVEKCIQALEAGRGDNVGGVWEIQPGAPSWGARSIAVAAAHPIGVGDAMYRLAATASEVDTVPFGSYRRTLIERIGGYNESLLTNEDYEFNTRIRRSNGRIWLDPSIRSVYYARATFGELIRQYWRYGYWKWRMLRNFPGTVRWRQALPPLFVLSLVGLVLISIFFPLAWWLLALELVLYVSVLLLAGLQAAIKHRKPYLLPGLAMAIGAMHTSWGSGFLWSVLTSGKK
ncbi:MAG: glycosyltransferase family 2 protein [Bacteroidota bacterium]